MSANPIQACLDMLMAPTSAFSTVKDKKGWAWLPFFLVIGMTSVVFVHYFSIVDIDWFQDQSLEQAASMTGMSFEELKAASSEPDATSAMIQTIVSVAITLVVVNLLSALYYLLATKVTAKNEYGFKDWYAFTWWTSMPMVISSLASILVLLFAADSNISMNDLQPTSLNSLIFSLDQSSAWFNFLEGINLFTFWVITLACIGLKTWLNIATKKAVILAVIPTVIIYGLWALYIVL
ncbi:YIP1 family protein [Thalassotalea profundi]|uniref:Membrane protein n=1 Tax=Thalassotalea profundi TaxID=2036687 RepID=A0ABQ3IUH1_9GAMM|nr:YIP1 family protein [Thalassotalea profundi]GHE93329.1 membrane protein [Thalassotalea profundi]